MYLSVKLCLEGLGEELSVVLLSHGAFWSQNNSYTVQLLQWRYSELVQVVCSLHCSEKQMLHAKSFMLRSWFMNWQEANSLCRPACMQVAWALEACTEVANSCSA